MEPGPSRQHRQHRLSPDVGREWTPRCNGSRHSDWTRPVPSPCGRSALPGVLVPKEGTHMTDGARCITRAFAGWSVAALLIFTAGGAEAAGELGLITGSEKGTYY